MILAFWLRCLVDYTRMIKSNELFKHYRDQLEELYNS